MGAEWQRGWSSHFLLRARSAPCNQVTRRRRRVYLSGEGREVHLIPPAHTCPQAQTSLLARQLGPRSAPGSCTRREASPLVASLPRCASLSNSNYSREGDTLPPKLSPRVGKRSAVSGLYSKRESREEMTHPSCPRPGQKQLRSAL